MSKKQKCADSYSPWECVIVAVDPGQRSGVAVMIDGELFDYGGVNNFEAMRHVAWDAYGWAEKRDMPLVAVIEKHTPHGRWGPQQFAGCAESVGLWKQAIRELPRRKPTTKIVRVNVSTWHSKMYSAYDRAEYRTEDGVNWKQLAIDRVEQVYAINTTHDVAEAILIGRWASVSGRIGDVLPKAVREGVVG